jgi:proteic killer suppression protein
MIKSWANSATRRFAEDGKSKFSGMDEEAAIDLLAALDAATSLNDLSPLKSVGLHKLSGSRRGQWAMTINGPWRICFRFEAGDAHDVEIVDYHEKERRHASGASRTNFEA